jgi:hypothetical protein
MEQIDDNEYILDVGEKFTNKQTGKTHEVEEGVCPNCGNNDLSYGSLEPSDDCIFYEWTCDECDAYGQEWYSTTFTGHNITLSE